MNRLDFDSRQVLSTPRNWVSRAVAACRQRLRSIHRTERGQNLIEFAFLLPIIFLFVLVIFDFGLALDRREVLQHAIREGARHGAVGNSVASIQDHTWRQADGLIQPADVDVCYVDTDGNGQVGNIGDSVRVSASYTYEFTVGSGELLTVFPGVDPGSLSIDMNPSADMRLESTIAGAAACP